MQWPPLLDHEHGGLNGWIEAGLFVLAISALNIVYALASALDANPLVFALYATAFAAAGTLVFTGLGDNALQVIRTKESWVFGIASIAMEAFYFLLLGTVTPAEASLAVRLSVPASLIVGWMFFARAINPAIFLGGVIIVAAVVPILMNLDPAYQTPAALFALACSAIVAVKTFSGEFHPWNRAARTVTDKMRVTGLVVLATGIAGMTACALALMLETVGLINSGGLIPRPAAFGHLPTIGLAIVLGAPILLAMNYLTFSSVVKIRTENFLASSAFAPLGALLLQTAAHWSGLIHFPPFDWTLLPLIALGIAGVMLVIRGGQRTG